MPKGTDIKVLLIAAFILVPVIFFPASSDLSVFMMGGKVIANGGELYKDYFDLKAPLTYYFFALLDLFTGGNIIITRIVDFILSIIFLLSVNFILADFRFPKEFKWIFSIIFSMSYLALNYSNTLQCETITYLPMIWYFYYVIRPNKYSTLIKALLLGIIISFKYSLGIIYIAEFFFISNFEKSKFHFFKDKFIEIFLSVVVLIITFLPTITSGNLFYFNDVVNYIDTYKSYPQLNIEFFKGYIKQLGIIFGDYFSMTFSAAAFIGLIYISNEKSKFRKNILNVILVFFMLLMFSFFVERKPTLYQFSRVYPFLILLSTFGIFYFYKNIEKKNKYILAFVLLFVLLLSPVPRVLNLMKVPISYFNDSKKYLMNFSNNEGTGNFQSLNNLAEYTRINGDNFIYMNTGSHQFLRMTNTINKYPQSAFYLAEYSNERVKNEVISQIQKTDYLIIQNDDNHYISFFNHGSSYDNFIRIDSFKNLLANNFNQDTTIDGRYVIFKRSP